MSENYVKSQFGYESTKIKSIDVNWVINAYDKKCSVDVSKYFSSKRYLDLYRCSGTGYEYWDVDESGVGDEEFYKKISTSWPRYYKERRWEYSLASEYITKTDRVLEIGCGRGYFLKSIEGMCADAVGLEFNSSAISNKVTSFNIFDKKVEGLSCDNNFDIIFCFQVLEHLPDVNSFIIKCLSLLDSGGLLVLSTPNSKYKEHRKFRDCFDMPPHHVGRFNRSVYNNMSEVFDLTLVDVVEQRVDSVLSSDLNCGVPLFSKYFNKLMYFVNRFLFFYMFKIPGHSMLAVYRK